MGGEHLQSINERELSGMIYAAVDVDTVEMQLFSRVHYRKRRLAFLRDISKALREISIWSEPMNHVICEMKYEIEIWPFWAQGKIPSNFSLFSAALIAGSSWRIDILNL